jgi:hypothetical protein
MSATRSAPAGSSVPSGANTATAPEANAWSRKARPSSLVPGMAANRKPGPTQRESDERPITGVSA